MKCYIYGLSDPETFDHIRYVGWAYDPGIRLRTHIGQAIKRDDNGNYRWRWIRSVLRENRIPMFQILEEATSKEEGLLLERKWIKYYKDLGHKLTNATDGGEGDIYPPYEATRRRISEAAKRNWSNPEYKQKMIEKIKKGWDNPESHARASASHAERWTDPQQRKMQSIRLTEHFKKPSSREVASLANKEYRKDPVKRANHKNSYTPEVRSQMSDSLKQHYANPEARELHSAIMTLSWAKQTQEARDKRKNSFKQTILKRKTQEKAWIMTYSLGERDYNSWLKRYEAAQQ